MSIYVVYIVFWQIMKKNSYFQAKQNTMIFLYVNYVLDFVICILFNRAYTINQFNRKFKKTFSDCVYLIKINIWQIYSNVKK